MAHKIRVLIAKAGLDGHDRGAKIVARTFRDAGMEVIYGGLHQSPSQIVKTAIQEDADVIAVSILSGSHVSISKKILDAMKEAKATDKILILGGTILEEEIPMLKEMGVVEVFSPGSPVDAGAKFLLDYFHSGKS
jgi:methylmalonyl-CoA mutase C-terminal domain/subunit